MYHLASASCNQQASKSTILYLVFGNMLFLFWHSRSEILEFDFFLVLYFCITPSFCFSIFINLEFQGKAGHFAFGYGKCCIYIFWSCFLSIEAYLWSICIEWNYFWILFWPTDFKFSDSFPLMYGRIIASLQLAYKSAGGRWYSYLNSSSLFGGYHLYPWYLSSS